MLMMSIAPCGASPPQTPEWPYRPPKGFDLDQAMPPRSTDADQPRPVPLWGVRLLAGILCF